MAAKIKIGFHNEGQGFSGKEGLWPFFAGKGEENVKNRKAAYADASSIKYDVFLCTSNINVSR